MTVSNLLHHGYSESSIYSNALNLSQRHQIENEGAEVSDFGDVEVSFVDALNIARETRQEQPSSYKTPENIVQATNDLIKKLEVKYGR